METLDICMDSCGEGANLIHRVGHHLLGGAVTGACNGGAGPLPLLALRLALDMFLRLPPNMG